VGDFAEIPHAEELKRKARFFAVKPQKMCHHDGEKVNPGALSIAHFEVFM
jgi:hypothetical protein